MRGSLDAHRYAVDGSPVDAVARCHFGRGWTLVNAATGKSNGKAYRTSAHAETMLERLARTPAVPNAG